MHILAEQIRSLDETAAAVDLGQTPAEIVFLSFTDSDLALAASVQSKVSDSLSLRLANLATLQHPFSVDLYLEKVLSKARFVLVRCLGGLDYWRYGIEELSVAARAHGFMLAIVPGDVMEDPRLDAASTLDVVELCRIWDWCQAGGPDNFASLFGWISTQLGHDASWQEPAEVPCFGIWQATPCLDEKPRALIIFYRAFVLAADMAPIEALGLALQQRGFEINSVFVTSLKDAAVISALTALLAAFKPDVILNTTGFSSRTTASGSVLECADAPVIQAVLATSFRETWQKTMRGLGAADLAMNVVLPEVDGRIIGPAISFKAERAPLEALEFTPVFHRPEEEAIKRTADLAVAWARLRKLPRAEKRIALVLSDYPAKGGRTGYAVGLDGPASLAAIADDLRDAGFDIGALPCAVELITRLETRAAEITFSLADYERLFATLPEAFQHSVMSAWGTPADDADVHDNAFRFKAHLAGKLLLAVQPDRGRRDARDSDYHDANLAPRHTYVAFYLWLRQQKSDAIVHLGTHGTLEWLPGKAVALSETCAPAVLVGATPVIYPFIVNNPGEAAQAKRRLCAVTIGHLTPPLRRAGTHGAMEEIEALLDEFACAQTLDRRRADRLADLILAKAKACGLDVECGLDYTPAPAQELDRAAALTRLDAWMCDVKDMRINDGLHVFGRQPEEAQIAPMALAMDMPAPEIALLFAQSAAAETAALIAALDGRFIAPGPAGAPVKGRLDVLPTGRNLYAVDPRAVPTRTAWEIGSATADDVLARYVQDHGDWPKRIVIDLWGSASMRTGGDDLAQAFALMGVRPTWDNASTRVSGFEILAPARLGRPRIDVTLRISGLFRDVFPAQIVVFDQAVKAVAMLDEDDETNPLAAASRAGLRARIYGAAPGAYGTGLSSTIATGEWQDRQELGEIYLAASQHAYEGQGEGNGEGRMAAADFQERVRCADAFVHVQDMAGQDVLDSDAFAAHEGGFAAAAQALGASPSLYHVDATAGTAKVRTVKEEVARVLRARATNPQWIAGQMRHGHRGAAEIAETIGNVFSFAAMADVVSAAQFDQLFEATLGTDHVRDFMIGANPLAAAASARIFASAMERGLWITRRNSVPTQIADTLKRAAA